MLEQGLRDRLAVAPLDAAAQGRVQGVAVSRGRPADLGQDPGSVGLGGRLDQMSGDHLLKGPVTTDRLTQPQTPVGRTDGLDRPARPARDDLRPSHRTTVTGCLTTHLVSLVMGRPQVLHDPAHTTGLGHDLNGRGPRGCPDLAHKRAHTSPPYGHLVPHHQTPNTAIPTKTHAESPKTHQGVTSQVRGSGACRPHGRQDRFAHSRSTAAKGTNLPAPESRSLSALSEH